MALLVTHAFLALWAVGQKSVTYDEILHVTGGFFYDRYGDFRIQPENGVLPQRLAGLPAALSDAQPPPLDNNAYWRTSDAGVISYQFFYEAGNDHWPLLMRARAMVLVFSLGTGLLIFCWSRALFGNAAGLLALALYTLDPNVLAHAALATSDTAATFLLLASAGAFWRALREPNWRNVGLSAAVLGLACVAKFSAVLLFPIFVLLALWHLAAADAAARRATWRGLVRLVFLHAVGAAAVIWAFYGFRYSAFAPELPLAVHFIVPWETILPHIGLHAGIVELAREWRLLPEAFLYGYSYVAYSVQMRSAFLAGDYSNTGWISFFPLAFAWKSSLAVLALLPLGSWAVLRRWTMVRGAVRRDCGRAAPLLVLFAVYWAISLTSRLNIGYRHLLPTFPVLFILGSGLASAGSFGRIGTLVTPVALILLQVAASLRTAPHFLAFFNALAGGPANGWRLLVDSSLDWGQDLPTLKQWLNRHAVGERAFLSYFGSGEPRYYRIDAARLEFINNFKLPRVYTKLEAGVYCISATMLQQVYSSMHGPWTLEHETEFQRLRAFEPLFVRHGFDTVPAELPGSVSLEQWRTGIRRFGELRFARLCHVLRAKRPDGNAGHSILIYRLSEEDVAAATAGTLTEWRALIERVASASR